MIPVIVYAEEFENDRVRIWSGANIIGEGPTKEDALIDAEMAARYVLDNIQARLHAERERLTVDRD